MANEKIFTLEVLKAKKGDSLMLHYGDKNSPGLVIIDGGSSGVFRSSLLPKLEEIKLERLAVKLPLIIDLIMVSHIDDDHIKGILEFIQHTKTSIGEKFKVSNLWHNSFDDIIGNRSEELQNIATQEIGTASLTSMSLNECDWNNVLNKLILASVPQGRQLASEARGLQIPINSPFKGLILSKNSKDPVQLTPGSDLTFKIISPDKKEMDSLQETWDEVLEEKKLGKPIQVVEYLDKSVPNLASLVVLVELEGKRILFTGDARGDIILRDLKNGEYLDENGKLIVDVLKLPHHGSSNNVEQDFFDTIVGDHYIISGDGSHGNPNVETFKMLFDSRRSINQKFTIHLTYPPTEFRAHRQHDYPVQELEDLIKLEKGNGLDFNVIWPEDGKISTSIELI